MAVTSNGAGQSKTAKIFMELVRIPSPSGNELNVMKYIQQYLASLGVDSHMDAAGKIVGSNSGNLIARIGSGSPRLLFMAHVDTVENGKRAIRPVVKGSVIRSDGTTILGSDDKAGVAALLEAIKELKGRKDLPEFTCLFTVREESGRMGATCIKTNRNIDFVFDVDGSDRPGRFVNRAMGTQAFEVRIRGREAHAAMNPEKGANAVKAASMAVARASLGRDGKGRILNIGRISGGRKLNVIPGEALLEGEVRAFDRAGIDKKLSEVKGAVRRACAETGCAYRLVRSTESAEPPLSVPENSAIVRLASTAAKNAGLKFSLSTMFATIQGNVLSQKGYTVLGLCKGGSFPHSNRESVTIMELEDTKRLIIEIVKAAKPGWHR